MWLPSYDPLLDRMIVFPLSKLIIRFIIHVPYMYIHVHVLHVFAGQELARMSDSQICEFLFLQASVLLCNPEAVGYAWICGGVEAPPPR
jgi:hypothetical protein